MPLARPRPWLLAAWLFTLAIVPPTGPDAAEARTKRRLAPRPAPTATYRVRIAVPHPPRAGEASPAPDLPSPAPSTPQASAPPVLAPIVPTLTPVPVLSLAPTPVPRATEVPRPPEPTPRSTPKPPAAGSSALPPGVALFTRDGRPAGLADVVAASRLADVVFLGEYHDDAAAHALERAVLEALAPLPNHRPGRPLTLSLEMFETDVQLVLDEYLKGLVRERDFLAAARPWKNYATDYRPLVELARERQLPVLAANAPHRYVMRVGRHGAPGLASLSEPARAFVPVMPWPTPSIEYTDRFEAFAREALAGPAETTPVTHSARKPRDQRRGRAVKPPPVSPPAGAHGHGGAQTVRLMFEAQWLRDTTMAQAIARHVSLRPGTLVVHVTGLFHSQGGQGTVEALRHYRPGIRPLTIAITRRAGPPEFVPGEMAQLGDFVAVTPLKPGAR